MADQHTVLVIDDDLMARKFIMRAIQDRYEVITAVNGAEGIEKAREIRPNIVLLDVEMPGINGFETCDQLKNDDTTADIPVIFLSSRSSLRERMLGYEVGAVDYFVKPFDKEELLAKFEIVNQYNEQQKQLTTKVEDASHVAFLAMKGSGELGFVLNFVEKSYKIETYSQLSNLISTTLQGFGLSVCFVFRTKTEEMFFSSTGEIKPLEKQLITMLADGQRFHDFGRRTLINYPKVSILVKNMPLNDMEKYGRFKDLLCPFLTAADSKITIIDAQLALNDQSRDLKKSMQIVKDTLNDISYSLNRNQKSSSDILQEMYNMIESSMLNLGLDEDQEDKILSTIDKSVTGVLELQEKGMGFMKTFSMVLSTLELLTEKQRKIINEVFAQKEAENRASALENDTGDMGVDMF